MTFSLDLPSLSRMAFVFSHLMAFALAAAAIAFADFAILAARRVDMALLTRASFTLTIALAMLWVTGLAVVWLDTGFDATQILARPKLMAKLCVVALLTANGVALHRLAFPRFAHGHADARRAALAPAVLGALSTTSWIFAAFLGVAKPAADVLGFAGLMGMYLLAVAIGTWYSVTFMRPQLAARMGLPPPVPAMVPATGAPTSTHPIGRRRRQRGRGQQAV